MIKKLQATIGMAYRASKLVFGETLLKELSKKKVFLVILASDASENTKKMILDKCKYYQVECQIFLNKEEIGSAISKGLVSAVGIKDNNLAIKCQNNMKEGEASEK